MTPGGGSASGAGAGQQAAGLWSVEDHLRGQPAGSVDLYLRFVELVEACGPVTCSVSKTMITFKGARRGFAGGRPTRRGLTGYLDLQRVVRDPRFISSSPYTKRLYVHQVRITRLEELDEEFAGWIGEAYAVGQGAHVLGPSVG
jgi:Domain of unknown function (DUF5655)